MRIDDSGLDYTSVYPSSAVILNKSLSQKGGVTIMWRPEHLKSHSVCGDGNSLNWIMNLLPIIHMLSGALKEACKQLKLLDLVGKVLK